MSNQKSDSVDFLGLTFINKRMNDFVKDILSSNNESAQAYHLVNAYTLSQAAKNKSLFKILKMDTLICDGKPLALYLSSKSKSFPQIRGVNLMRTVLASSSIQSKHFFLGSTPEVLSNLTKQAESLCPQIQIAGVLSPPFKEDFAPLIDNWCKHIVDSGATIVWIGMGTPKQDFIGHEIARETRVTTVAVGVAFSYFSGDSTESPEILQKLGCEWIYRFFKEPRRLFFRYTYGNSLFVLMVIRDLSLVKFRLFARFLNHFK